VGVVYYDCMRSAETETEIQKGGSKIKNCFLQSKSQFYIQLQSIYFLANPNLISARE